MKETINERVVMIIDKFSKNPSDFANKIGKQPQTIYNIVQRGNKPGAEILEAILNEFPQIDALWLVCGIGTMEKESIAAIAKEKEIVDLLKRENEILVRNNESLIKDKEFYRSLVEKSYLGKFKPVLMNPSFILFDN